MCWTILFFVDDSGVGVGIDYIKSSLAPTRFQDCLPKLDIIEYNVEKGLTDKKQGSSQLFNQ